MSYRQTIHGIAESAGITHVHFVQKRFLGVAANDNKPVQWNLYARYSLTVGIGMATSILAGIGIGYWMNQ